MKIWQRRSGQIRLATPLQRVERESSNVLLVLDDFRSKQKDHKVLLVFNIAIAGSVLFEKTSEKMDATATVLGVLLKSKSVEVSYSSYLLA